MQACMMCPRDASPLSKSSNVVFVALGIVFIKTKKKRNRQDGLSMNLRKPL